MSPPRAGALRRLIALSLPLALVVGPMALVATAAPVTDGATLNGAAAVTVSVGATITAAVTTTAGGGVTDRVGSIGWRIATTPGTVTCVDVTNTTNQTVTSTFPVTAPTTPGTYDAYVLAYTDNLCTANPSNQVVLTNGVVVRQADLAVSVSDGVSMVTAGDGVTRTSTITVSNIGTAPAGGVSLTDTWPAGFAQGTVTPSKGSCSGAPSFTCQLGTIGAGAAATVTVEATVPAATTSTPQVHTVVVATTSSESSTTNDTASDSDTVTTSADLSVTKDDGVTSVRAGDGVTRRFTITAANAGPSDAQSVQVADTWPAGYVRGTVTNKNGSCAGSPDFTCDLGTIAAGTSRSITVAYTVPGATTGGQTNTASVTSSTADPAPGNGSDDDTNAVVVEADLAVSVTDGVSSVAIGGSTTYTVTVTNRGPAKEPAGVVVSVPIPAGTSGSEAEADCSIAAGVFTCTAAAIASNRSVSYGLTIALDDTYAAGSVATTASITGAPATDPVPGNDAATDTDTVPGGGAVTFTGQLAGPGLADMYPVDVVDSGSSYYVIDPGRYRVCKIDRTTGSIVATRGGHQGRAKGQFGAARAVSVDAAGNVYVADTPNNRIQVLSPNLDFIRMWGTSGTGPGQFSMVYGVTVGPGLGAGDAPDEVVYTTDGSRVQKFTRTGTYLAQFGQGLLNQPRQLAVHPVTHDLYVVSARDREIVVFDQHGVERFRFGGGGTRPGKFMGDIRGIDIDDAGRVYVSDDGNHRVQVFDSQGTFLFQFGNTGTGHQYLTDARGLAVTHDGIVAVADEWDFGVKEYRIDASGTSASFSRMLFGGPPPAPGFNAPRGIAVDPDDGSIFAVDWWNQRIQKFSAGGTYLKKWGHRGTTAEPGSINFAWDAAVQRQTGRRLRREPGEPRDRGLRRRGRIRHPVGHPRHHAGVVHVPAGRRLRSDRRVPAGRRLRQRPDPAILDRPGRHGHVRDLVRHEGERRRAVLDADRRRRGARRHDLGRRHTERPGAEAEPGNGRVVGHHGGHGGSAAVQISVGGLRGTGRHDLGGRHRSRPPRADGSGRRPARHRRRPVPGPDLDGRAVRRRLRPRRHDLRLGRVGQPDPRARSELASVP